MIKTCLHILPDEMYLRIRYFIAFQKKLSLKNLEKMVSTQKFSESDLSIFE